MDIAKIAATYFPDVPDYKDDIGDRQEAGWVSDVPAEPVFVEPGIRTSGDLHSCVWLVDAPGAMGKSMYAKALARQCGAIYVNLADSVTIGSGFVTDALDNLNLLQYRMGRLALVFDALDEAFLRVSFESRMHFFANLLKNLRNNAYPAVIFGRKAAIMEARLILEEEEKVKPAGISLEYFTPDQALTLVEKLVAHGGGDEADCVAYPQRHHSIFSEKAARMLSMLGQAAVVPDENFSGYAPVLEAVAAFFRENPNYSSIHLEEFTGDRVLLDICDHILKREQKKLLDQLGLTVTEHPWLYDACQQMQALAWISADEDARRVHFDCGDLRENLRDAFTRCAREFIEQHPFLEDGTKPANAVFAAAIQSYGLKYGDIGDLVLGNTAPSPLLNKFYFNDAAMYGEKGDPAQGVPPFHVEALLGSCQALADGDGTIVFNMSQDEENDAPEVRISHIAGEEEKVLSTFKAEAGKRFIFNQPAVSWIINGPGLDISFNARSVFSMRLPVDIDVKELRFNSPELLLIGDGMASFVAEHCDTNLSSIRYLGSTEVLADWPGPVGHPWARAGQPPARKKEPTRDQKKAFFSFCRLIRAFRSHSRGNLARFDAKIDHARMLKNHGDVILEWLKSQAVIVHDEDRMYILFPKKLAETTGAHYVAVINYEETPELWNIILKLVP